MKLIFFALAIILCIQGVTQPGKTPVNSFTAPNADNDRIITGADRIPVYLPYLKGKRVGVFANQTSVIGNSHLVDSLSKLGVNIKVIFGPEHGFRGTADAGEKVQTYIDEKTGIKVVSL